MANKFDVMHLRFARVISDPVATASTAGAILSTTERDDYLNRAIKYLQEIIYSSFGIDEVTRILESQVKTASITFSSSGVALPADDIGLPLSVDDGTSLYKHYPNRRVLVVGLNADVPAYAIDGSKIYAYDSSGIKSSGSASYVYIAKDEGLYSAITILLADTLIDIVVYLAAAQFSADTGNTQDVSIFMENVKLLLQGLKHE